MIKSIIDICNLVLLITSATFPVRGVGQVAQVVDPVLGDVDDIELAQFCELATWCLEQDGSKRPRMSQAADVLRDISERHAGWLLVPVLLPLSCTLALAECDMAFKCFHGH